MKARLCIQAVAKKAKAQSEQNNPHSQGYSLRTEILAPSILKKLCNMIDNHNLGKERNPLP